MVEFTGVISGEARDYYIKKAKKISIGLGIFSFALLFPLFLIIGISTQAYYFIYIIPFEMVVFIIVFSLSKSAYTNALPNRITVQQLEIICYGRNYTEAKLIRDIKLVRDHGTFYEVLFPFGNYSDKFICQKDLLTKGTLKQFEKLCRRRIRRVYKNKKKKPI